MLSCDRDAPVSRHGQIDHRPRRQEATELPGLHGAKYLRKRLAAQCDSQVLAALRGVVAEGLEVILVGDLEGDRDLEQELVVADPSRWQPTRHEQGVLDRPDRPTLQVLANLLRTNDPEIRGTVDQTREDIVRRQGDDLERGAHLRNPRQDTPMQHAIAGDEHVRRRALRRLPGLQLLEPSKRPPEMLDDAVAEVVQDTTPAALVHQAAPKELLQIGELPTELALLRRAVRRGRNASPVGDGDESDHPIDGNSLRIQHDYIVMYHATTCMDEHADDGHRLGMNLPVFFAPEMVASPTSYSPSAAKPAAVVADWNARGLPLDVRAPVPVTEIDLCRAHDRSYVRGVLSGEDSNGFGCTSPQVAASLPWTSGAMLTAARHALSTRGAVSAPCSGFHHAGWDHGHGFCTFNGLMVTALALLAVDRVGRVGILDCDQHYGDGTEDILERLSARQRIHHFTAGGTYHRPAQAKAFLAKLPAVVRSMADCDVILYQAGADPHVNDPLGGWLTDEQLAARDRIVFETARAIGVPLVWNLAGGYQRDESGGIAPVLAIHAATARASIETWGYGRLADTA